MNFKKLKLVPNIISTRQVIKMTSKEKETMKGKKGKFISKANVKRKANLPPCSVSNEAEINVTKNSQLNWHDGRRLVELGILADCLKVRAQTVKGF